MKNNTIQYAQKQSILGSENDLKLTKIVHIAQMSTDEIRILCKNNNKKENKFMNGYVLNCDNRCFFDSINFPAPAFILNSVNSVPIIPTVTDVRIIVPNKVVEVTFSDKTKEKAVCHKDDTFALEAAIAICISKKIMGGSSAYNNAVKRGIKVYKDKLKREELDRIEKERIEKRRAKRLAYKKRREEKKVQIEKERQIEIQKEAYIRAMEYMNNSEYVQAK